MTSGEKNIWVFDLAALGRRKSSRWSNTVVDTIRNGMGFTSSISVIRGQLLQEDDSASDFRWFCTSDTFECCVSELHSHRSAACELFAVVLPQESSFVLGTFLSLLNTQMLRSIDASLQIAECLLDSKEFLSDLYGFENSDSPIEPLKNALLRLVIMAEWAGRIGKAVFFAPYQSQDQDVEHGWSFTVESFDELRSPSESDDLEGLRQYLLTAIGTDLFGFHPRAGDLSSPRYLNRHAKVSTSWRRLSNQPYQSDYFSWYRQEFGSRRIGRIFTEACWQSICDQEKGDRFDRTLLPLPIQNAIGTARLCRRLATWTLEGRPFQCTVVLLSERAMDDLGSAPSRFAGLIDIRPPTSFNLHNEGDVRRNAELAQSQGLFLLVSAKHGLLCNIGTVRGTDDAPSRDMRHDFLGWLAGTNSLVFDIRSGGSIFVYGKSGLFLEHDGFQWSYSPIALLTFELTKFFTGEVHAHGPQFRRHQVSPDRLRLTSPGHAARCSARLADAVRRLLEDSESSIFALLDSQEEYEARTVASEMLRPDIGWSSSDRVDIDGLDSETLAGLLHLDGAHLISRDGYVISIARRIAARPYRDQIPIPQNEYEELNKQLDSAQVDSTELGFEIVRQPTQESEFSIRIFVRVNERTLESWGNKLAGLPTEIKKRILKVIDADAPHMYVVQLRDLTEREASELEIRLREWLDTPVLSYYTELESQAVPAFLLPEFDVTVDHTKTIRDEILIDATSRLTLVRIHVERFPHDIGRLQSVRRWPTGVAYDEQAGTLYFEEDKVDDLIDRKSNRDSDVPDVVRQQLLAWRKLGKTGTNSSPGTGTRAADELSTRLPRSLVIKVSASGGFKVLRAGRTLILD